MSSGRFATVLLAAMSINACSSSLSMKGTGNGGTSGQGGVSGMAGTSSQGGASGQGGVSGHGGQPDAAMDAPVDVGVDANGDGGWTFQDCGTAPQPILDSVTWIDSGRASSPIPGAGTGTLSSVGGTTTLTLSAHYSNGTVSGETEDLTAVLTGGATVPAKTYNCGADATATYMTRMGNFPVSSCVFTLENELVLDCRVTMAKGTFSMMLVAPDGGTRQITEGAFNVGVTELVPPARP